MTSFFDHGDDLNDLLGAPAAPARALPADETFARIRASVPEVVETCPKCRGTGRFIGWSGRALGQCFACKGKGSKTFKTTAETRMQNRAKAAEPKANTAKGNWERLVAEQPAEAAVLTKGSTSRNERWASICTEITGKVERYGDLHEGTLAMLQRAVARDAEYAAQRVQKAAEQQEAVKGINVANIT